jgi:hypothetical protein
MVVEKKILRGGKWMVGIVAIRAVYATLAVDPHCRTFLPLWPGRTPSPGFRSLLIIREDGISCPL